MCLYSPEVMGTGRENNERVVLTFLTGLKVFFFFFFEAVGSSVALCADEMLENVQGMSLFELEL